MDTAGTASSVWARARERSNSNPYSCAFHVLLSQLILLLLVAWLPTQSREEVWCLRGDVESKDVLVLVTRI